MPKVVWRVKLVAELHTGKPMEVELACFERDKQVGLADLGLSLAEAKQLLPDLRGILLEVAGAEVQHRASRRAPSGKGTMLRSTVMQWSVAQHGKAEMA